MNALLIERIWEDVDFYEVSITVNGTDISVTMPTYINDEMILELSIGMYDIGSGKMNDYFWECGEDEENATSYASMKIYKFNVVGKIAIDFVLDNKLKKPYRKRVEFSIMTETNSLLEFSNKIKSFTGYNLKKIEGIYLSC